MIGVDAMVRAMTPIFRCSALEYSSYFADIDECSVGTHGCAFNCTNTIGSYSCSCDIGYHLNEDGLQCDGNP